VIRTAPFSVHRKEIHEKKPVNKLKVKRALHRLETPDLYVSGFKLHNRFIIGKKILPGKWVGSTGRAEQ
jgi:hypothetical protein